MQVHYNAQTDLLYLRFDGRHQDVINREVSSGVMLDLGQNDHIVGIEIMDASRRVDLHQILPVESAVA